MYGNQRADPSTVGDRVMKFTHEDMGKAQLSHELQSGDTPAEIYED